MRKIVEIASARQGGKQYQHKILSQRSIAGRYILFSEA
jgi:hypothetical protein